MLLDIYPHNSLDEVTSQIAEREVLKCLTYLALEQQVAKGLFSIEHLFYGIPYLTILNSESVNVFKRRLRSRLLRWSYTLKIAFLLTILRYNFLYRLVDYHVLTPKRLISRDNKG